MGMSLTLTPTQTPLHRGYKRTAIGVIPEDWTIRSLLSCLRSAPNYGINAAAIPFDDALPTYLRISDIGEDNQFRPSPRVSVRHPSVETFFLNEGDLVFARTGASVGKSYLYNPIDGPLVFAGFLIRVSPNPGALQPIFLAYYVQSKRYWNWVASVSIRSGQPGINGQEYGTLQLPLPGPAEQTAIATALSDVDALLGGLDRLIAKKRDLKQAAMQQLLTGQTRLPGFSGEWETKQLGDLLAYERPDRYIVKSTEYSNHGDIPVLTANKAFILGYTTEAFGVCADLPAIVFDDFTTDSKFATAPFKVKSSAIKLLRPRYDRTSLRFLFDRMQLIRFPVGDHKRYYISDYQNIRLPIPESDEQLAVVSILSDMDAELAALETRRDKTHDLKQVMMQELLTGRTRLVAVGGAPA